eukprot:7100632-Pyramimonas_sp.AAC.1
MVLLCKNRQTCSSGHCNTPVGTAACPRAPHYMPAGITFAHSAPAWAPQQPARATRPSESQARAC